MMIRAPHRSRCFIAPFLLVLFLWTGGGVPVVAQVTFSGNGNGGFGGPVGESEMEMSDDGTTVTVTFTKGSGGFNDYLVLYLDAGTGGRTVVDGTVNDNGDRNRAAISNIGSGDIVFPVGFEATHAIAISTGFGGLWQIPATGTIGNNGLPFVDGVGNPSAATDASFTFSFDWSEIGLSGSDAFAFVATYGNPTANGNTEMFSSDEAYGGGLSGGNPGTGSFSYSTYFAYPSGSVGGSATTAQAGLWSTPATWTSGNVPLPGDAVTINHDVTLDQNATVASLEVASGNTFTASDGSSGYTLTVAQGGALLGAGTFAASDGTVVFPAGGSVPGNFVLNHVSTGGGLDFSTNNATVTGTLTITAGGFAQSNSPTYAPGSTLRFDTGASFDVTTGTVVWRAGTMPGVGVPNHVTVASTNPLRIFEPRTVPGTLTVENGGQANAEDSAVTIRTLTIEGGGTFQINDFEPLTVEGDITVDGTLNLSGAGGGDLFVGGDLTINGTFNVNERLVAFNGSGAQSVGGTATPLQLDFVEISNTGSGVILNAPVEISDVLTLTSGTLTSNGRLTLASTATETGEIAGTGSGSISGDVTMQRYVGFPDGANTNDSHFRMLGAPFATELDGTGDGALLSNVWTQATGSGANATTTEANASVYRFDEGVDVSDNLAEGWLDVANLDNALAPGAGRLVYLFETNKGAGDDGFPVTLAATGTVAAAETGTADAAPALTFTDDDDPIDQDGWNLIANPFAAPIDWESIEDNGNGLTNVDATIYVWDPENGQYATYTADGSGTTNGSTGGSGTQGRYIAPFQAFFVKATGGTNATDDDDPDLDITANDKATGQAPSLLGAPKPRPQIALRLSNAATGRSERTAFTFDPTANAGKDAYDAYQLKPFGGEYALVASRMKGTEALFDHQQRPMPTAAPDTIPLALDLQASGTFTLAADTLAALPADWQVLLHDLHTGATYNLEAGAEASFSWSAPQAGTASGSPLAALRRGAPPVAQATNAQPTFQLIVGPVAPLPVERMAFEATAAGTDAVLTWTTATETNNAGFAIQHQAPGASSFARVGFVEGAGTTSRARAYRFRVSDLAPGRHRFRLRQVDTDGTASLSDSVVVDVVLSGSHRLSPVAPNPVRDQATLVLSVSETQSVRAHLYNVLGQRVATLHRGTVRPHTPLRLGVAARPLPSGVYLVRVDGERFSATRRFTVVR